VSSRQILLSLSALAVGMAVAGAILFVRYGARAAGSPTRVAVTPFDLPDDASGLEAWRVGLATRLTDKLPASGDLSTVPQAQVAATWRATTSPIIAAVELARRTSAGLALYGRVERAPGDSLLLRAAVIDALKARGLFEVAVQLGPPADLERAADTLAALVAAGLRDRMKPAVPDRVP
jgi:hypothetical protein